MFDYHVPGECLQRHRHDRPYAALVLEGGYVEAGDRGRFAVRPGQVALHGAYEAHANVISHRGARILNLPIDCCGPTLAEVADPDEVVRLAERDVRAAVAFLSGSLVGCEVPTDSWPDALARKLINNPDLDLGNWAIQNSLAVQSLSRGFRREFGVTPKRFRAEQRALHAVARLPQWQGTHADLAADLGFVDQAHMIRSVREMTGKCPSQVRVN